MIIIAAGSSLPFCGIDSQQIVLSAFSAIGRFTRLVKVSSLYDSPAWPDASDPRFVNAVAVIETDMEPAAMLAALHAVETGFGRRRAERNAPRTLDLDLIDYEGRISGGASGLHLPHPRLAERDFVLAPLAEIAPNWRHPENGLLAAELLDRLPGQQAAKIS